MNKKQLKKELQTIKGKYLSLNEMGETALKKVRIDKYVDCLENPDLKEHLIKTGLARNIEEVESELPDYETAQDIIGSFEYDLELLSDEELIIAKSVKEAEEKALETKKKASKMVINKHSSMASASIRELYSNIIFTDNSTGDSSTGPDIIAIAEAIKEQEKLLAKGDLCSLENMLLSQTHVLNSIFSVMACKINNSKYINQTETYSRIALKAQNQTRQTISTLAEIKGIKRTTFIHQVNQAHNQQVNNGAGENLNNPSNEKGFNHVDRTGQAEGTRKNTEDQTLVIPKGNEDARGEKALSHECSQTWGTISQNKGDRETVSSDKTTRKRSEKAD